MLYIFICFAVIFFTQSNANSVRSTKVYFNDLSFLYLENRLVITAANKKVIPKVGMTFQYLTLIEQ